MILAVAGGSVGKPASIPAARGQSGDPATVVLARTPRAPDRGQRECASAVRARPTMCARQTMMGLLIGPVTNASFAAFQWDASRQRFGFCLVIRDAKERPAIHRARPPMTAACRIVAALTHDICECLSAWRTGCSRRIFPPHATRILVIIGASIGM